MAVPLASDTEEAKFEQIRPETCGVRTGPADQAKSLRYFQQLGFRGAGMSALAEISAPGPVLVTGKKKSALDREARAYLSLPPENQAERSPPAFDSHVSWSLAMSCGGALSEAGATEITGLRSRQSK